MNQAWLQKLYEAGELKSPPKASQEPDPVLFPHILPVWEAFCFLNERRSAGANGPNPISAADMDSYARISGQDTPDFRRKLVRFIPPMDRAYLKDFYDRQSKELEKARKQGARKSGR